MGLSAIKNLAKSLHGSVTLSENVPKGAKLVITFPKRFVMSHQIPGDMGNNQSWDQTG